MWSVAPSTLVATPLPWISKGSPLPSLSLSTFPFFRALPEQVEEPWTFSVAPSTMGATPLPWISKGSPIPLPLQSSSPSQGAAPSSVHHHTTFYNHPAQNTLFVLYYFS